MEQVINGIRYNTETASLIAQNHQWVNGRKVKLYQTAKGRFFAAIYTQWVDESDRIVPLEFEDAKRLFEKLPDKKIEYSKIFGEPEEA